MSLNRGLYERARHDLTLCSEQRADSTVNIALHAQTVYLDDGSRANSETLSRKQVSQAHPFA